jgi:hypothetical protein
MEPPLPSPRRRFQFRLRTLMIGVTLLAVACGFAALVIENRKLIQERDETKATVDALWQHIRELMKAK